MASTVASRTTSSGDAPPKERSARRSLSISSANFQAMSAAALEATEKLDMQKLSASELNQTYDLLRKRHSVKHLIVRDQDFSDDEFKSLVGVIGLDGIRTLELANCRFNKELLGKILTGTKLENLTLKGQELDKEGYSALTHGLSQTQTLNVLQIAGGKIDADAAKGLVDVLKDHPTMMKLEFSELDIEKRVAEVFEKELTHYLVVPPQTASPKRLSAVRHMRPNSSEKVEASGKADPPSLRPTPSHAAPSAAAVAATAAAAAAAAPADPAPDAPSPRDADDDESPREEVPKRLHDMAHIEGNDNLFKYYCTFLILFQGTLSASRGIQSGKLADAEKTTLEQVCEAAEAIIPNIPNVTDKLKNAVKGAGLFVSLFGDLKRKRADDKLATLFATQSLETCTRHVTQFLTLYRDRILNAKRVDSPDLSQKTWTSRLFSHVVRFGKKSIEKVSWAKDEAKALWTQQDCTHPAFKLAFADFTQILLELANQQKSAISHWRPNRIIKIIDRHSTAPDPLSPRSEGEQAASRVMTKLVKQHHKKTVEELNSKVRQYEETISDLRGELSYVKQVNREQARQILKMKSLFSQFQRSMDSASVDFSSIGDSPHNPSPQTVESSLKNSPYAPPARPPTMERSGQRRPATRSTQKDDRDRKHVGKSSNPSSPEASPYARTGSSNNLAAAAASSVSSIPKLPRVGSAKSQGEKKGSA